MPGAGRKRSEINEKVYPLLKEAMLKTANQGGNTSMKQQCSKYRKIALELGFKEEDFPDDVKNGRMQRFDRYLGFTLRACNQKKVNRKTSYEIDRLSRYVKDLIKRNIAFACASVESWILLERKGKLK